MSVSLSTILNGYQSFLANGLPNSGGFIYTYAAGTTTPTVTYATNAGNVANANPIVLGADGRPPNEIWLTDGIAYKLVVADATTAPIAGATYDNIYGAQSSSLSGSLATSTGASLIGGGTQVVTSINGLRALLKTSASKYAFATGYYASGDGGGGEYWYDSTDNTSSDNGGSIIVAADGGRWKLVKQSYLSVKQFGAKGDGTTGDITFIQNCINALQTLGGGEAYFPDGTYEILLSVTQSGIRLRGESDTGTILQVTSGTAANYAITVDLSGGGVSRPLSFGMENFTINGDSNASRQYNGLLLYNVYKPDIKNIRFKAIGLPIVGKGCFFGSFEKIWFEHYSTGISGFNASYGLNSCTFTDMNFFEGNVSLNAIPYDGTHCNNNTWINASFSAANALNANGSIITGLQDTFINPRLESINTTGHWMTITIGVKIINPLVTSSVSLATGKYVFDVTGNDNTIDCDLMAFNRVVRIESGLRGNVINVNTIMPVAGGGHILDLSIENTVHYGGRDHAAGNTSNSSAETWSDFHVYNLLTKSINQANIVADGLTVVGLDAAEAGPNFRGGCYKYTTPIGNRQITQTIGAVATNECYVMSFWVKAVSGGEQTIKACMSESPLSDYADVTITSTQWIRVAVLRKFTTNNANAYWAVQLPVAHPGVWIYGPQVVYLGSDATPGEVPPYFIGGYVPTDAAIRRDRPHDAHRFQVAAPTSGTWFRGDDVVNILSSAGSTSPGWHCITDGSTGGTWKALANIAA